MKLVTLDGSPDGLVGAIVGADVADLSQLQGVFPEARCVPATVAGVIAAGESCWSIVRRMIGEMAQAGSSDILSLRRAGVLTASATTRLKAPIPRPGILLSHARAYRSHVAEMSGGGEQSPGSPIGFMKNVNSIIGSGASIVLPAAAPDQVDFEGEISVVFSKYCFGATLDNAMEHVFGFTIVNDVSARDWVPDMAKNPDLNRMGKQFPTFCPMGPCVASCDELPDVANIHMTTRLNGQVMQDAHTRDLIWSIPELIVYYSKWYPFAAGDVLTTGSPAGVGYGRSPKVFLRPGDVVTITVDGVGELSNGIVAA